MSGPSLNISSPSAVCVTDALSPFRLNSKIRSIHIAPSRGGAISTSTYERRDGCLARYSFAGDPQPGPAAVLVLAAAALVTYLFFTHTPMNNITEFAVVPGLGCPGHLFRSIA